MKTMVVLLFISIGIVLTALQCESVKTNNLIPEGYVKIEVSVDSSIDSCGCNVHIIKTLKNKSDTLEIKDGIGKITSMFGDMIGTSILCNLPKGFMDTTQNKKYPVIFSGEEHSPYDPIIGPTNYTYSEIVITELFIKL